MQQIKIMKILKVGRFLIARPSRYIRLTVIKENKFLFSNKFCRLQNTSNISISHTCTGEVLSRDLILSSDSGVSIKRIVNSRPKKTE